MTILERMRDFSEHWGKSLMINGDAWRYYRLGNGAPLLWLTGGLRRAAIGFAFMERLATRHTIIAPDYPPLRTIDAFIHGFDAILRAEGVDRFALGGQSYGGLLAQAYLARKCQAVERLILSSTGPANFGKAWLPVDYAAIALARLLPEKTVKNLLTGGLLKAIALPETERDDWRQAIDAILYDDLSRADVISHFAVAADIIRKSVVTPAAYRTWTGRIVALSAENDPTQSKQDILRYERLFGRKIEAISLGEMGHAAALFNPAVYVELLEQALA